MAFIGNIAFKLTAQTADLVGGINTAIGAVSRMGGAAAGALSARVAGIVGFAEKAMAHVSTVLKSGLSRLGQGMVVAGLGQGLGMVIDQFVTGALSSIPYVGTAMAGLYEGIKAGISAVANVVTEKMQQIVETTKAARAIGISTEALVGFRKAAGPMGEEFEAGIQHIARELGQVALGSTEASEKFKRLGLDANALNGMGLEQAVKKIADRIKELPSPTLQAAAAFELMGKGGPRLLEVLGKGSAGLDAAIAKAKKSGLGFTAEQGAQVELASKAWKTLGEGVQGLMTQVTIKLAPLIWLTGEALGSIPRWIGEAIGALGGAIEKVGSWIASLGRLAGFFGPIGQAIADFGSGLSGVAGHGKSMGDAVGDVFSGIGKAIDWIGTKTDQIVRSTWNGLLEFTGWLIDRFNDVPGSIKGAFDGLTEGVQSFADSVGGGFQQLVGTVRGWIASVRQGIDWLTSRFPVIQTAIGAVQDAFANIGDKASEIFGSLADAAGDAFEWVATTASKVMGTVIDIIGGAALAGIKAWNLFAGLAYKAIMSLSAGGQVFDWLIDKIQAAVGGLLTIIDKIQQVAKVKLVDTDLLKQDIAGVAGDLKDRIKNLKIGDLQIDEGDVQDKIDNLKNGIQNTLDGVGKFRLSLDGSQFKVDLGALMSGAKDWLQNVRLDVKLDFLTGWQQKLEVMKGMFDSLARKAKEGDADAAGKLARLQSAAKIAEGLKTPEEKFREQIGQIKAVKAELDQLGPDLYQRAIDKAAEEFQKGSPEMKLEMPKASLQGTAAALEDVYKFQHQNDGQSDVQERIRTILEGTHLEAAKQSGYLKDLADHARESAVAGAGTAVARLA